MYDINSESLEMISEDKIQEPAFSPDGTKVAYGRKNNVFIKDLSLEPLNKSPLMVRKTKSLMGLRTGFTKKNLRL